MDDVSKAIELLENLGAPPHLIRHHRLVAEAATQIVAGIADTYRFDRSLVLQGAAIHDAGKILAPSEMHGPGSSHESLGRQLLESKGHHLLARFCETHADWRGPELPIEDRLVALADKLWKGKRVADLEELVMRQLAREADQDFWAVFEWADPLFERVADGGNERLSRS